VRVLGVDPGLVRTGWAVAEPDRGHARVSGYGLVAPPPDAALPERLAAGARQLRAVLAEHTPDLAALEEIFTAARHPRSALLMAHMRGVICLVLHESDIPILPMTATTVKQRLTGNGHASKEQIQHMVLRLTGLDAPEGLRSDVTDAIALALAGLQQSQGAGTRLRAGGSRSSRSFGSLPVAVQEALIASGKVSGQPMSSGKARF
jgi:crossover junction endodeoxyribonuclease RuvC